MSGRAGKVRKKRISRSAKAGVVFPVSRICRYMRQTLLKRRIAVGAPIYLSAVLEYLCAEVLELAGNAATDNKRKVITPRHILLAVANDDELHKLLKDVTISQGGVLPHISEVLLVRKGSKSKPHPPSEPSTSKPAPKTSVAKNKKVPPKSPTKSAPKSSAKKVAKKTAAKVASRVTVLSEKTLFLGQKLTVIQGDLAELTVDAVVHPTNATFNMTGQCGTSLKSKGGDSLEAAVKAVSDEQSMAVSEAVISGSGDVLPCKHVIHVHSPQWSSTGPSITQLEASVTNCLTVAENKGLSSIAFPSIASGANNFPKQTAAQTILRTIKDYFTGAVSSQITQVYFVLYDMESIGVYTLELSKLDV